MSLLCEMSSSTCGKTGFEDLMKTTDYDNLVEAAKQRRGIKDSLETVVAELKALEADPQVRLADEEEELRDCLMEIRDGLRKKKRRGAALERQGVTMELIRRYRKDYADTDWGC